MNNLDIEKGIKNELRGIKWLCKCKDIDPLKDITDYRAEHLHYDLGFKEHKILESTEEQSNNPTEVKIDIKTGRNSLLFFEIASLGPENDPGLSVFLGDFRKRQDGWGWYEDLNKIITVTDDERILIYDLEEMRNYVVSNLDNGGLRYKRQNWKSGIERKTGKPYWSYFVLVKQDLPLVKDVTNNTSFYDSFNLKS
jgi:hypothetical protein